VAWLSAVVFAAGGFGFTNMRTPELRLVNVMPGGHLRLHIGGRAHVMHGGPLRLAIRSLGGRVDVMRGGPLRSLASVSAAVAPYRIGEQEGLQ